MICRTALAALILAYATAVPAYGLLSDAALEHLPAVALILLGLPWLLLPLAPLIDEAYWPAAAVAAPIVNIVILRFLCRFRAQQGRRGGPIVTRI